MPNLPMQGLLRLLQSRKLVNALKILLFLNHIALLTALRQLFTFTILPIPDTSTDEFSEKTLKIFTKTVGR